MLKGSLVALVTPMLENGDIDYPKLEKLIDFHVSQCSNGLVIAGTTGESATLDFAEHCEFLHRSREIINQRLPMIAGSGANSTKEAIHLTQCALEAGADAGHGQGREHHEAGEEGDDADPGEPAAVAESDVEEAVRPEADATSVVVAEGLVDGQQDLGDGEKPADDDDCEKEVLQSHTRQPGDGCPQSLTEPCAVNPCSGAVTSFRVQV